MKARAPGKIVLSGAYAVLHGAPALVTAVDRYVVADTTKTAERVTPETLAALPDGPHPWFDAAALRAPDRKLGLGSSAAIVVACVCAARGLDPNDPQQREALFQTCLAAHRHAQGGGSGIDVAAATFGGTLCYQLLNGKPSYRPVELPPHLVLEVWSCREAADTREFLQRVAQLTQRDSAMHRRLMQELEQAANQALTACEQEDAKQLLEAWRRQAQGLMQLGDAAEIPIFTPPLRHLAHAAARDGAVVLPAGAGGGDIALYVGTRAPGAALRAEREACGLDPLLVQLGAAGVHRI